jgi:predicted nucleic acid-binding protein
VRKRAGKVCWDASVFLAWLNGEDRGERARAGLNAALEDLDARRTVLIVPAIVHCEVWENSIQDQSTRDRFGLVLRRSNVVNVDITHAIAKRAGALREACRNANRQCPAAADAMYVAAALEFGADELHSFDNGMLGLNGFHGVAGLAIVPPRGAQMRLDL